MISEVMENGPRHTLQIGSDCLGVKGESFMELGKNRGGGDVGWGGGFSIQTLPRNELLLCLRWSFQSLKVLEGFLLVQNNHKKP